MEKGDPRAALDALIRANGEDMTALSRMLGRNPAYIQQFIKRGSPRRLAEEDRRKLARYFGVGESVLGGSGAAASAPVVPIVQVPRLAIGASAGPGAFADDERPRAQVGFQADWLRTMVSGGTKALSIIQVEGHSMAPTLCDGDEIMVDRADTAPRRDAIYVIRMDDALHVKRVRRNAAALSVISDNPAYESWPDRDPATVEIIGRVVWAGRKIS